MTGWTGIIRSLRTLVLLAATLMLSSCYLPNNFTINIQITRDGDYAFEYDGSLTHLGFLQKLANRELDEAGKREYQGVYERDLKRDKGFSKVEFDDQARYLVKYRRQGNMNSHKSFSFARRNGWFLRIARTQPGVVELNGNKLPKNYIDALIDAGFDTYGTIRVWTNAEVGFENATSVQKGDGMTLYEWQISSMRNPSPRMVLAIK